MGEILDLPKKFSKTRETSIISDPQLNTIAPIPELLKIFSEVIVASKCGPLARMEKQVMSLKLNQLKSSSKIGDVPVKAVHI